MQYDILTHSCVAPSSWASVELYGEYTVDVVLNKFKRWRQFMPYLIFSITQT